MTEKVNVNPVLAELTRRTLNVYIVDGQVPRDQYGNYRKEMSVVHQQLQDQGINISFEEVYFYMFAEVKKVIAPRAGEQEDSTVRDMLEGFEALNSNDKNAMDNFANKMKAQGRYS